MNVTQPTTGLTTGTQTISGAKTFDTSAAVTSADGLTVNGIIVPQTKTLAFPLNALNIAVSSALFIADESYQITAVRASWGVASISMNFNIEKLTGTTAPGSGTALLQSVIDTSGTANTVISGTLTATTSALQLAVGDRIGMKIAGTITSLVGLVVIITLKRI